MEGIPQRKTPKFDTDSCQISDGIIFLECLFFLLSLNLKINKIFSLKANYIILFHVTHILYA